VHPFGEATWRTLRRSDLAGNKIDICPTALGQPSYQEGGLANSISGGKGTNRFADARVEEKFERITNC
jgi:hypothetical protein